ncbi:MAG: hypothetical protein DRR08_24395 [Candidatus Parabeggiatoa sp. nov. 2]|nr:MAG: hypothetical protein B6247_25125 [Beggiatoa sp. 4572_84]RKZ55413.1 MAG: hypothetical protein DRR08_24395 [Gammaproteobacteria bacterium]
MEKFIVVVLLALLQISLQSVQAQTDEDIAAARAVCYSALTGNNNHSIILVPLPNNVADLDAVCHTNINGEWHAGGVAKGYYFYQNCRGSISNRSYGGGYTSYVTEKYFEANRKNYSKCNATNAFICCSPQFPN